MTKARITLIVSLLAAVGGWLVTMPAWTLDALSPANVGGLAVIVASVVASACGVSIIKPK